MNKISILLVLSLLGCSSSIAVQPPAEEDASAYVDSGKSHPHFDHDFDFDYDFWKVIDQVRHGDDDDNDASVVNHTDSGVVVVVDGGTNTTDASVGNNPVQDSGVVVVGDSGVSGSPQNNPNSGGQRNNSCVKFLDVWICKNSCNVD